MSLKFDIEWKVRSAIAKVRCGNNEGTAFFIDKARLLTAKHVVMNYFANNEAILVKLGDEEYPCNAIKDETLGSNIDVAILTPINPYPEESINCIHPLPLLASETPVGHTYYIIGYPQEIGNGVDQIKTEVVVLHKTAHIDYDIVVSRIDQLSFYQYDGYSGSPVFNELGKVVGIATDQLSKSLAFTSVFNVRNWLLSEGIDVDDNWRSNDMSKFGLGKSQEFLKEQINYIGSRYTPNAHVENNDFEQRLLDFANISKKQLWANQKQCNDSFSDLIRNNNIIFSKKKILKQDIHTFQQKVEVYLSCLYKDSGEYTREEQSLIHSLEDIYKKSNYNQRRLNTADSRIFLIKGNAGLGKTHYVCHISRKLVKKQNVYLFFGSQFGGGKSIEDQICMFLHWENVDIERLDNEMTTQGRYALFIIDALNEGPDAQWWNSHLRSLCDNILSNYSNIKLIVTSRTPTDGYFPEDRYEVEEYRMPGFIDIQQAVLKYFKEYDIKIDKDEAITMYRNDFRTPLFLKMFCEVHKNHPFLSNEAGRERSYIYYHYLSEVKNIEVSQIVDEDPEKNVTFRYMMDVARASVLSYNCSTIPRRKARYYGDKICRWRTWSHSLLHAAEQENLLMPVQRWYDEDDHYHNDVMFEYQTLGDFLKAYSFINIPKGDDKKLEDIYNIATLSDRASFSDRGYFLKALFSEWDGVSKVVLDNGLTNNEWINSALKESLEYNGRQKKVVAQWLKSNVTPKMLVSFIDLYSHEEIIDWHNQMCGMTLHERDIRWTTLVNGMLESETGEDFRDEIEQLKNNAGERTQDIVTILCWMLTSSNPIQRNIILRELVTMLRANVDIIIPTIDMFKECNDPYVMEYLYAAIYGVVLRIREKDSIIEIAQKIYDVHYKDNCNIPMDVSVRQWTLMILEKAKDIKVEIDFHDAVPPFTTQPIPEVPNVDGNNGDMFGTDKASQHIYWSLYGMGDFARYVLGSDYGDNRNFYVLQDGNYVGYPTTAIQNMIVYYILNHCQWGTDISSLDTIKIYGTRFDNRSERIGKKYQWLGLRWAYAILSDNCKVSDDYMHNPHNQEEFIEHPYPWYLSTYSRIDPTLTEVDCNLHTYPFTINMQPIDDMNELTLEQWNEEHYLPAQNIVLTDNDDNAWMVLINYDSLSQKQEDGVKRKRFLYNNSFFYHLEDEEILRTWASDYPFYPRNDMPEHTGSVDFLWNEIPWADTFKRDFIYDENDNKFRNGEPTARFTSLMLRSCKKRQKD